MPASEDVDAAAVFEGTPFDVVGNIVGAHPKIIRRTKETAEAVVDHLEAEGGADHDDVAPPQRGLHRLNGRRLAVGQKPSLPIDAGNFYWEYVVPTVRTHPSVRLEGYALDAEKALSDDALDTRLAEATLPGPQRDRLEGYVRDCYEYLREIDSRAHARELHDVARSVPGAAKNAAGHQSALGTLATLPGVEPPDPATPAWRYVED